VSESDPKITVEIVQQNNSANLSKVSGNSKKGKAAKKKRTRW